VKANEAVAGIGSNMSDVGVSLDRARDRVAQMQARAAATDELLASGALKDLTAAPDADIDRQLAALSAKSDIDRQLQSLKQGDTTPTTGRTSGGRGEGPDGWLSIGEAPNTP
jgi:phage shock protein A